MQNQGSEIMKIAPCYNCVDREVGCHSNCNQYQRYKNRNIKKRTEGREFAGYLFDAISRMKGVRI